MDIACTLGPSDLKLQQERWRALERLARIETDDGLRLVFRDEPAVESELHTLVAIESRCCGWADWNVERREGELVVAARTDGDGIAVLHSMFV